jgi:5-methylcytosine-specific restriction enzyme subunit McrC
VTVRTWRTGDTKLELSEYETVFAEEALVSQVADETWSGLGLNVSKALGDPADLWRVKASRYVGVVRLVGDGLDRGLRILPKLNANIFFLADYAFGTQHDLLADRRLHADLDVLAQEPAAALIAWMLADVESFVRKHLRRQYVIRREVLEGSVRGNPLLDEYVSGHLAHGHAEQMPSEFYDLTTDNLANQVLKATVREAMRLTWGLRVPEAQRAIRRQGNRLLPLLAHVTDRPIRSVDIRRVPLRGSMRHYRPVIEKCRSFLEGLYLSENLGDHVQDAFLWNMNTLYQEALRGALVAWPGATVETARPARAKITGPLINQPRGTPVTPDYVLRPPGGPLLLLDAKYKDVSETPEADETDVDIPLIGKIRVSRADVYQAIAYSEHTQYLGARAGLIFPIALPAGRVLPLAHRIEGFTRPVHLLFFDVGPSARANLPRLYQQLDALASGAPAAPLALAA